MRLDEISRLHKLFVVLGQHLTYLGQVKGQILAKNDIFWLYTLIASKRMCRSDLKPSPACFPFHSEQYRVLLLYPAAIFSIRIAPK